MTSARFKGPFIALGLVGLSLALAAAAGCAPRVAGLQRRTLELEGQAYQFELHVPETLDPLKPVPLLIVLHRLFESGQAMAYMTSFNLIADREGFIVAYPNALGGSWDTFGGDFHDDVRFVLAVIEKVASVHSIDRDRIYVTGASNGGFMTHVLACAAPETFAAVAPVKGLLPAAIAREAATGPPMPILIIHGTKDGLVPYDARSVLGHETLNVDDAVAYWAARNGCNPTPAVEELEDRDPGDRTRVTVERYGGGDAPVVLYRVEGGGHTWPGGREPSLGILTGRMSRDLTASDVIWEFFAAHGRDDRPPTAP
ncbi:MAG: extracellular catalytic domain type 1 short-chain-length polyhydroxyalkanoate depolymerase [Planctomycetota bacterium]|jgi:polyhydroxybutyrate depolymerase